jgi:hypothetical protein
MRNANLRLIAILSLPALAGCTRLASTAPDRYEVLIHHLSLRVSDLSLQLRTTENQCLAEENAMLEGKRVTHLNSSLTADDDRLIDNLLDSEDFIEEHNRRYPNRRWADVKGILTDECGDCQRSRSKRDLQIMEEAKKPK